MAYNVVITVSGDTIHEVQEKINQFFDGSKDNRDTFAVHGTEPNNVLESRLAKKPPRRSRSCSPTLAHFDWHSADKIRKLERDETIKDWAVGSPTQSMDRPTVAPVSLKISPAMIVSSRESVPPSATVPMESMIPMVTTSQSGSVSSIVTAVSQPQRSLASSMVPVLRASQGCLGSAVPVMPVSQGSLSSLAVNAVQVSQESLGSAVPIMPESNHGSMLSAAPEVGVPQTGQAVNNISNSNKKKRKRKKNRSYSYYNDYYKDGYYYHDHYRY